MARANPVIDSFTRYLKDGFTSKEVFNCIPLESTFTHAEVKQAMNNLKNTDPKLHRILTYRYMTNRSRNDIANSLYMDSSTLKRSWDKAISIIIKWLLYGIKEENQEESLITTLPPLDLAPNWE